MGTISEADGVSTIHRARRVLALRPFRRLWFVSGLCSSADWLTVLALAGLASDLAMNAVGQNFAFSGVLFANLLPGLLFAPIGGLLADRFDRRRVMAVADLVRCAVLVSIAVADSYWWIFAGTFLIQIASIMWIPSKDAAVPNLLRRPAQVESATQLGLVMTYGFAVLAGGGLFVAITGAATIWHLPIDLLGANGWLKLAIVVAAALYLVSGITIATRLPELSLRNVHGTVTKAPAADRGPGMLTMLRESARYISGTPLVRGLLLGMMGAFAAGGMVVGSAQKYAMSLMGGQAAFGLLLISIFAGLVAGMVGAPKLARRLPHDRLFGVAVMLAGTALVLVALSPHLAVSLVAVAVVGACAGAAFLTGVTIIGSRVEDSIRGRINAVYQSMLKVVLGSSVAVAPLLVTLMQPRHVEVWGRPLTVDGTRPVILGGALVAVLAGLIAYRQMSARHDEPVHGSLRTVLRGRPHPGSGVLITVEGTTAADTASQADRLADWLGRGERDVVLAADPALDDERLTAMTLLASLSGSRARALVVAAVRAELVERVVRPALEAGSIVVMERFADSPFAQLSAAAGLDTGDLEGLAQWATAELRPDVVVLLDAASAAWNSDDHQWHVRDLLAEMATIDPDRYLVVDGEGTADEVGERVRFAVWATLTGRLSVPAPALETALPGQ